MAAPYFEFHVFVCCNRRADGHTRGSCAARGSEALRDHLKKRVQQLRLANVRINMAGCLDRCELGPAVVVYPQGTWYTIPDVAAAEEFLQTHLVEHHPATHLEMPDRVP